MTNLLSNFKTAVLGLAIMTAAFLQCTAAEARDIQRTIIAGGCFWCVEHDFEKVAGVVDAVSGYAGGTVANPTYKQVTAGGTGHYEVVQITFDADVISERELYDLFFRSVDPTDAGGQFCDRGESYRTAIFAQTNAQAQAAQAAKAAAQQALGRQVVTPILGNVQFYPAEAYHQNYARQSAVVVTRRGPMTKANAYKFYRQSCGRDARVAQIWGRPFSGS